MSLESPRHCFLVVSLFLFTFLVLRTDPLPAGGPSNQEPSFRCLNQALPEPPWQHKPWKPPASSVPQDFVAAARLLFKKGFGDPRGCLYCEIEVAIGSPVGSEEAWTHGWVLPSRTGEKPAFAVCWNGLVYPVLATGKEADLVLDVVLAMTQVQNNPNRRNYQMGMGLPGCVGMGVLGPREIAQGGAVCHPTLGSQGDLAIILLLRSAKANWRPSCGRPCTRSTRTGLPIRSRRNTRTRCSPTPGPRFSSIAPGSSYVRRRHPGPPRLPSLDALRQDGRGVGKALRLRSGKGQFHVL